MINSMNSTELEIAFINIRICICFFVSLTLLLTAYYISKKPKTTKKNNEHNGLISPILAEVLIDGKIDIKNLILTTIAELQIKKNIAIVNDNVIELLHKDNLNLHEIYLVDMIFQDKKLVTFNEINDRFIYVRTYETNFLEHMSKITDEIQTKLYKMKLFSRKRMMLLNFATYLNLLIFINLPSILLKASLNQYFIYAVITIALSGFSTVLFWFRLFKNDVSEILKKNELGRFNKCFPIIFTTCLPFGLTFTIFTKVNFNIFSILGILTIFCSTLLSLRFAKNNVLSDKGIVEYKKIVELKNYLAEYNFKKREGENTYIIWDEYFAYAAALGIPNEIIVEIYRRWNKIDVSLWFTENLI